MTIARRLIVLLAVPLLALSGLGLFTRLQLARVEQQSRFAESRIVALATLGNLSRSFSELRVNVRTYLLAPTAAERAQARAAFDQDDRDVTALLRRYADGLVTTDKERRMLEDFEARAREWRGAARRMMELADTGRSEDATRARGPASAGRGGKLRPWPASLPPPRRSRPSACAGSTAATSTGCGSS